MRHTKRRTRLGHATAIAALSAGCMAEITSGDPPGAGVDGPAGSGASGGSGNHDPEIDKALQEDNPELFDVAIKYFPGLQGLDGRARLARLTHTQFDVTTETLVPSHFATSAHVALPPDPLEKNYEYASNLNFNQANFTPFATWVTAVADSVRQNPQSVINCSETDTTCLDTEARAFVRSAFREVVSDDVLDRFSAFYVASVDGVGFADATADLVDVTLASPRYAFRDEVQVDGTGKLLPANLLQNITYTLADAPPGRLGLSLESFDAQDPESVEATIQQVLSTPEAREKLLRFFISWLEVKEPDAFDIDPGVFPEWTAEVAAAAVAETEAFLKLQLSNAAPTLKDVTESTESFVTDAIGFLYGSSTSPDSLVPLDPSERLGIFTQPAVIASHSGPTTTRLVKRGVFFTRKVMCLPLGMPPAGTDTTIPDDAGATERERIETVTQPPVCAGCHAFINPFGFMLENFDAIGRFRTTDEGVPVDASINVEFLKEEGPLVTDSPVEALRGFTQSMQFQQCFARQMFRFYTGRDEVAGDDPVLRQMFFNFANDEEQGIVRMLQTLANTPAFSRRSEAL